MKDKIFFTAWLILALATFTPAQNPSPTKPAEVVQQTDASEYRQLVGKIKSGDMAVDFTKLRAAYLDWVRDECNQTDAPRREEMVKAFEAKEWAKAAELGTAVLDYEFANHGLHFAVANAYKELKNAEKEKYHAEIANKLFKGLLASGDGKTAETAYKVHSIREEYQIMRELGYQPSSQALVMDDKLGPFDVLSGKNADGKEGSFYFNISSFFGGGKSKPCKK